jgi:N-acyl-D-aspartate/D-glutamate deacylase
MLDTVVTGGLLVDGTGEPPRQADVGIKDGRVVAVGAVEAEAAVSVDAAGKVVAPGFIDVHTHYDAQAFWDPALSPSPLHGVTTIIGGNCGFSIAPAPRAEDAAFLLGLLARVEAIPPQTLRAGAPWDWTTTEDFLGRLEGNLAINAGFMVGHSAIRRAVMGPAASQREATEEELDAMCDLLRTSLEAGGMGFSSSWTRVHMDPAGNRAPSRYGNAEELKALAAVLADCPGTSLEMNPSAGLIEPWGVDLIGAMSATAQRTVNWNLMMAGAENAERCWRALDDADRARSMGGRIVALAGATDSAIRVSISTGYVFDVLPGWDKIMLLPTEEKLPMLRDPSLRAELRRRAESMDNVLPQIARWDDFYVFDTFAPENECYRGHRLGEVAETEGRDAYEVMWDIALADDLLTTFGFPEGRNQDEDWKVRAQIWTDPRTLVGGSDAGAHLEMLSTFNFTTRLLGEGYRQRGVVSLEQAVKLITAEPADLYGLVDRGRITEGAHADVVVFDPTTIGSDDVELRTDLPAGARRLYASATGIDCVLVGGEMAVADGELTGTRSGKVLRSGQDSTETGL